jgi:hypothetical protein
MKKMIWFAVFLFSALSLSTAQAVDWPSDPAAMRMQGFIVAYNSESDAALKAYFTEAMSPEFMKKKSTDGLIAGLAALKPQTGKLAVESVQSDGIKVLVKVTAENLGALLDVVGKVGAEPPHYLLSIGMENSK